MRKPWKRRRAATTFTSSLVMLTAMAGAARAATIETGNTDVSLLWGNTLRYNIGARAERRDPVLAVNPSGDEGNASVDRGHLVVNRLDLLSELDFTYRGKYGARVSAAAWYNDAYDENDKTGPGLEARRSYSSGVFSNVTRRFHRGPSGEILDAYVFASAEPGGMQASLRLGRQANLWGEALVLAQHSISYAQQPIDGLKATASPGIDNKEVQLPVSQIYATLQVNEKLSLAAQYLLEWRPTRLPQGGTYLASTDFLLDGPDRFSLSPTVALRNLGIVKPENRKEWGLSARYKVDALDAILGAYYRVYDEKGPTLSLNVAGGTYSLVYPHNVKLLGFSVSKLIAGASVGAEVSYRRNAALASSIADGDPEGARGNTLHFLANAVQVFGPMPLWSSLAVTGEVAYSHLDKITRGETYFSGCERTGLPSRDVETGCASRSNWLGTLRVTPSWVAVRPGWDLSATGSVTIGLSGNGPTPGGGNYRAGNWTVGATATYNSQHDFTLAYNDFLATNRTNPATGAIVASNGAQMQDRGWLSFTYKYQF